MIICRKCQRHHPDSAAAGTCACGADLAVDGIALVQTFVPPPAAEDLDELPPLGGEAGQPADPAADEPAESAAVLKGRQRSRQPVTPKKPATMPPPPPGAVPTARAAPVGAGRRARSVSPKDVLAEQSQDIPNVGERPPEAPPPDGAVTVETEPVRSHLSPGELACPACTEPNNQSRRFCQSCGTKLPAAWRDVRPDTGGDADTSGRRRSWRQRARAASRGRLRYAEGFTAQVKMRAAFAIFALVAAVVALAGPGRERVLQALGRGSPDGLPATAEVIAPQGGPSGEVAGFGAANALDDDRQTGVAIVWEPDTGVEPNRLRLTLEEPADLDRIAIAAGLADDAPDAPLVRAPSRIRMCADTGSCQEIGLQRSDSLRSYGVSLGDGVRSIELTVLAVHDTKVVTYPLTVISELRIVD